MEHTVLPGLWHLSTTVIFMTCSISLDLRKLDLLVTVYLEIVAWSFALWHTTIMESLIVVLLAHSLTHPPTHSPTHPLTHPTHPLTQSPTTHPLTHPIHPLTHSLPVTLLLLREVTKFLQSLSLVNLSLVSQLWPPVLSPPSLLPLFCTTLFSDILSFSYVVDLSSFHST